MKLSSRILTILKSNSKNKDEEIVDALFDEIFKLRNELAEVRAEFSAYKFATERKDA